MESIKTENMNEVIDKACKNIAELVKAEEADRVRGRIREAGQELKVLAGKMQNNVIKSKRVMLGAIEILLAGDIPDDDLIRELEHVQQWMQEDVSASCKNSEEGKAGEPDTFLNYVMSDMSNERLNNLVKVLVGKIEGNSELPLSEDSEQESNGEGYKGSLDFVVKNIERIFDAYGPPIHRDALRILMDRLPERERRDEEEETRENLVDELLNDIIRDMSIVKLVEFVKELKSNGKLKVPA